MDVPSSLETVVLQEEGFQDVYMSAVENPGLFFVQLMASGERSVAQNQKNTTI